MKITVKDFKKVTDLTDYLKSVFINENHISVNFFMATDETYWKENLTESGFVDTALFEQTNTFLNTKKYTCSEFSKLLDFIRQNTHLGTLTKEFYEIEVYTRKNIYFINPAVCRILVGKKNFFDHIMIIGDVSCKYWKYVFYEDSWHAKKLVTVE